MASNFEMGGATSSSENTGETPNKWRMSDVDFNGEPATEGQSAEAKKDFPDSPNNAKWHFDFDSLTKNAQKAFNDKYDQLSSGREYEQNREQYISQVEQMGFGELVQLGSQLGFNNVQEMHKKLSSMSGQELYGALSPTTKTAFTLEDLRSLAATTPELDFALGEVESGRSSMDSKDIQGRIQLFVDGHAELRRSREFSDELSRMPRELFIPKIQEYNFGLNKFEASPFIFGDKRITLSEEQSSELSELLSPISKKREYDNHQLLESGKTEYQEAKDRMNATIADYLATHTPLAVEELPRTKDRMGAIITDYLATHTPIATEELLRVNELRSPTSVMVSEAAEPTNPNKLLPDERLAKIHRESLPTDLVAETIRENTELGVDKIAATKFDDREYSTADKSRQICGTEVGRIKLEVDRIDKMIQFVEIPDSYQNEARRYVTDQGEARQAKFGMITSKVSDGEIVSIDYFCPGNERRDGYAIPKYNAETGSLEGYFLMKISETGELTIVNNNYGSEQLLAGTQESYNNAETGYYSTLEQGSKDVDPSRETDSSGPKELYRGVVANRERMLQGINTAMRKFTREQPEVVTEGNKDVGVLLSRLLALSLFPAKERSEGTFASANPEVASIYIVDRTRMAEGREGSGQEQYGIVFKIVNSESMSFHHERWRDASPDNYVSDRFDFLSPLLADGDTLDLLKNVTIESITTPNGDTYSAGSEDFNSVAKQLLEEAQKNS